jgi:UDP-glucose 4-epimerase
MAKILVTGGCGFIGSHTIVDLVENGYDVISVDSNIRSTPAIMDGVNAILGQKIKNYCIDLCDLSATKRIFDEHSDIEGVIHFAALKSVGESVNDPYLYYNNNLNSLNNILYCVESYKIPNFIFSSSCSVYGNSRDLPVTEDTPLQEAESPYGHTKQIGEGMVKKFSEKLKNQIKTVSLRYFNPAGAHPSGLIGEISFGKPIYLVPVIMEVAFQRMPYLTVFGNDYPTRDGSCVRDFIHIMDLAQAHTGALRYLKETEVALPYDVFNLGIGDGVTVLEAIRAYEKVAGKRLNYQIGERRAGDVVAIYANYEKAAKKMAWEPRYTIEDIIRTSLNFEQRRLQNK